MTMDELLAHGLWVAAAWRVLWFWFGICGVCVNLSWLKRGVGRLADRWKQRRSAP